MKYNNIYINLTQPTGNNGQTTQTTTNGYPLVLIPRLERPEGSLKDTYPVLPFLMGIIPGKKNFVKGKF